MNGSPSGGSFRGLPMTGSGSSGSGGGQEGNQPSWMSPDVTSVLRPAFYPRLESPLSAASHFYAADPSRLLQGQLATITTTAAGSAGPLVPPLSPFHHHHQHPSPLLPSPYHLYSPLSPGGYAHAAAAAALSGGRPPYLDPSFLAGPLPRYRYLLPGTSTSGSSRFPPPAPPQASPSSSLPSPAAKIDASRSLSESENLIRWRSRPGSSPKPPAPMLPLIPETRPVLRPPRAPDVVWCSEQRPEGVKGQSASASGIGTCLPTQPYYPSHFMRGTVIQLASGELKRVEDLNTEDFVRSANLSNELKMDSSTVVKIEEKTKDIVLLCFSVGEHKVQVSVEATVEHPFFVIGQGWSSCSPERTRTLYGLPCQRLQVGDICISLTHRDIGQKLPSSASTRQTGNVSMVMKRSESGNGRKKRQSWSKTDEDRHSVPLDLSEQNRTETLPTASRHGQKSRRWSCS